jgi:ABC-type multidrug transport system permease subunit
LSGYGEFPSPIDRFFKNFEVTSQIGAYYFSLGPLITFTVLLQEIARDKEYKLRQGLNVVGVSHLVYWINWIFVGTMLNLIQTSVLMITGSFCGFQIWENCPHWILFNLFFSNG